MLPKIIATAHIIMKIASPIEHSIMPIIANVLFILLLSLRDKIPITRPITAEITAGKVVQQHITEKMPKARDKILVKELSLDVVVLVDEYAFCVFSFMF